jgi:uncharacterized protein (UPF0548 family)
MLTTTRFTRIRTVLMWPLGIAIVSWRYMWRTIPLHRSEEQGTREKDLPEDDYDTSAFIERLQPLAAGVGPMLHRTYGVRIVGSGMTPEALISLVTRRLNQVAPEVAEFRQTSGRDGGMHVDDEFVVRMPGPWDGPVRVVRRDQNSFRLATLQSHLEAGEIEFRVGREDDGALRFEIESWARAGDPVSALLYNRLRLAKEIQLNMWTHFCIRTARLSGGRPQGGITIRTREVAWT